MKLVQFVFLINLNIDYKNTFMLLDAIGTLICESSTGRSNGFDGLRNVFSVPAHG